MSKIELIFREQMNDYIQPLKDKGCNIWSISRLNNFNTCLRQYYLTYIEKKQQKPGIYGILGTSVHSDLEDLYEGKTEKLEPNNFNSEWTKSELFNISFPVSRGDIKGNYKKDLDTFYKHYKKMDGKFISELGFVLKIDNKNYIMGYIDLLELIDDKTAKVFDFKTSAMFKDKKIIEASRQLIIYQMALEQLYGLNIIENGWIMLKYLDVEIDGYKPKKAIQCKDLMSKCETQLRSLMKKNKIDEFLIEMYLTECFKRNDVNILPEEIRNRIKIKTHYKPCKITEESKSETMEYIKSTIAQIESMDKENEDCWECKINDFFCSNLCGYGNTYCKYKDILKLN